MNVNTRMLCKALLLIEVLLTVKIHIQLNSI